MSEHRNADLGKIQASAEHALQAFCAIANVIPGEKHLASLRKVFDDIRTDADGPYLVTSDTREDWQCDTEQQVRAGLAKRGQWSEPFSVFRFDGTRFVKVFLSEDATPKT